MKILCLLFLSLFTIACATPARNYESQLLAPSYNNYSSDDPLSYSSGSSSRTKYDYETAPADKKIERVMLYNAYLYLDVDEEFDTVSNKIKELTKNYSGYVLSYANDHIEIRIPPDNMEEIIEKISELGEITRKNILGQDITDRYYDTKLRLENAQKTRDRLIELFKKADSVETILKIEVELQRIENEIELFKGQLERMNHLKSFCTMYIYYSEKQSPGIVGWVFVGVYEGIKWLFVW